MSRMTIVERFSHLVLHILLDLLNTDAPLVPDPVEPLHHLAQLISCLSNR
jgi:hypothetical protein